MLDPAIKLFGKTISLPSVIEDGGAAAADDNKGNQNRESTTVNKEQSPSSEEKAEPITLSSDTDETNKEDDDQETTPERESSNKENEQSPAESQEKPPLKKPGKIIPCPRCSSMDTKFCYYNNYNVNQPRHFCKKCQRYWTAGGTMRNVPVGAGRRKNKSSASPHCRHLTVSDAIPDQIHQYPPLINPNTNPNGTVLSFGSNGPLSVLNLADRTNIRNGFIHQEEQQHSSAGSTVTASSSADEEPQRFTPPAPPPPPPGITYMNGSPWPYQWSPIPFYPAAAAYWGCIPWLSPVPSPSPAPSPSPHSASLSICAPNSPTLGKHPREGDAPLSSSSRCGGEENCLWFPKTLRIHDPEEAAKSSLWATMGLINNDDKSNPVSSRGGLFRPLHAKEEHIVSHKADQAASHLLYANPAALLRSINFHESL